MARQGSCSINILLQFNMAKSNTKKAIGSSSSCLRWNAGSVSGLASSRVQEAGSGLCGESCKPPAKSKKTKKPKKMKKTKTNIRVATWNLGSLNKRNAEVVETLSRRQVDICGVQEHRLTGSLQPNQVRTLTDKGCKFNFYHWGMPRLHKRALSNL